MAYLVQKFGGTSLATPEHIQNVAGLVERSKKNGVLPVVVVSAMAGVTNQLASWAQHIYPFYDGPDSDIVLSSGESIVAGLLAMALQKKGVLARAWLGWQVPFVTTDSHGCADIIQAPITKFQKALESREVPVVCGFQGITRHSRPTTLGRGGSDISAVFLAASLKAPCDIYTDVLGVYTADPQWVPKAQLLKGLSYQEMMAFSSLGAQVVHPKAIKLAHEHRVVLSVRSTFFPEVLGTSISAVSSQKSISGVVHHTDCLGVCIKALPREWPISSFVKECRAMGVVLYAPSFRQTSPVSSYEFFFVASGNSLHVLRSIFGDLLGAWTLHEENIIFYENIAFLSVVYGAPFLGFQQKTYALVKKIKARTTLYALHHDEFYLTFIVDKNNVYDLLDEIHQMYFVDSSDQKFPGVFL